MVATQFSKATTLTKKEEKQFTLTAGPIKAAAQKKK